MNEQLNLCQHTTSTEESTVNPFLALRLSLTTKGIPCSQRNLAKLFNQAINHSHISELERGKPPSLLQLNVYRDFFGCSYEYLLGKSCEHKEAPDSLYQLMKRLSQSKDARDRAAWQLFLEITGTDYGLVLLHHLSEWFNCSPTDEEVVLKRLAHLKSIKNREKLTYQEIIQLLDNMQEEFYE